MFVNKFLYSLSNGYDVIRPLSNINGSPMANRTPQHANPAIILVISEPMHLTSWDRKKRIFQLFIIHLFFVTSVKTQRTSSTLHQLTILSTVKFGAPCRDRTDIFCLEGRGITTMLMVLLGCDHIHRF